MLRVREVIWGFEGCGTSSVRGPPAVLVRFGLGHHHPAWCPKSPQFRCDEKGFLAICAFGLPGRSHEDGPARGIQAALAIVEAVKVGVGAAGAPTAGLSHAFCLMRARTVAGAAVSRGVLLHCTTLQQYLHHLAAFCHRVQRKGGRACCGVTTGQLFCAMVGSQRRSEYTVFGNAINLRCRQGRGGEATNAVLC